MLKCPWRILFLTPLLFLLAAPARAGYPYLLEGFENQINWDADTESAATGREVSETQATEGKHSLKLFFKSVSKAGKASFSHWETLDFSPYGALLLDLYNPTDLADLKVGIVIFTDAGDHEFITPPLEKGWNKIRVDLTQPVFSTSASNYKPVGYLVDRGGVGGLEINLYPGDEGEGAVFLDNIRLEPSGLLTLGALTLNTTLEGTLSAGDINYLPPGMRIRPGDVQTIESFETGTLWPPDQSAVSVSSSTDTASNGKTSLSVSFPAAPDGFNLTLTGIQLQLAGSKQVRFDVYNPGLPVQSALQLMDNQGNTYFSSSAWIGHGWNTPVFDFTNQHSWNGAVITGQVLQNLASVVLNVSSRFPGKLYFDGVATSAISLNGAANAGTALSLSYNPAKNLEVVATTRAYDNFYGSSLSDVRDAGPELYLDSVKARLDTGDFRTGLFYRQKVTALDNPINQLVNPDNLGNEIAALQTAGRVDGTQIQALFASRLQYEHYNSRIVTDFGPDSLATLRVRQDMGEGLRLGCTLIEHLNNYAYGVSGLPLNRQTLGFDVDNHLDFKGFSLTWALEAAGTSGDLYPDNANRPADDRFYLGSKASVEWGRLKASSSYSLFGYDFDGDFTTYGSNHEEFDLNGSFNLDGFWIFKDLKELPIGDGTLGQNLNLNWGYTTWYSRDRYLDAVTGVLYPFSAGTYADLTLENDNKAHPHFNLRGNYESYDDQWSGNYTWAENLRLRFPGPLDVTVFLRGRLEQNSSKDKTVNESGTGWTDRLSLRLEKYFKSNLYLYVTGEAVWSRKSWEGVWGDPDYHFKWTAGFRQSLGANMSFQMDYGYPALYGYDFGIQDTINVVSMSLKAYF